MASSRETSVKVDAFHVGIPRRPCRHDLIFQRQSTQGFGDDDLEDLWFSVDSDEHDEDDEDDEGTPWWNENVRKQRQQEPSLMMPSNYTISEMDNDSETQTTTTTATKSQRRPDRRWIKDNTYWDLRLRHLEKYHEEHGHINVPFRNEAVLTDEELTSDAPYRNKKDRKKKRLRLGQAVFSLRNIYKRGELEAKVPSYVVEKLNQLGMTWTPIGAGRRPAQFQKRIQEWKALSSNNGTLVDNDSLRNWMWTQRYLYGRQQQGRHGTLTPDRIQALTEAGILPFRRPKHILRSAFDAEWDILLKKWQRQEHNDPTVMLWAWEQHRMYNVLRRETVGSSLPMLLKGPRLQALTKAGFFDTVRVEYSEIPPEEDVVSMDMDWDTVWSSFQKFHKKHQHCRVTPKDVSLYSMQRRLLYEYKQINKGIKLDNSLLDEDRIRQLQAIGVFNVTTPDSVITAEYHWWEAYHELRRYRDLHGTVAVKKKDDADLHEWLQIQQKLFERTLNGDASNGLTETHFVALSRLGVVFEQAFKPEPPAFRTAQNAFVGQSPAVLDLDKDLIRNLTMKNNGSINGKRKESIEDLVWMARYNEMSRFIDEHGHSIVEESAQHNRLALWAYNQRMQHPKYLEGKKTSLSPRRIEMLRKIGFEFENDVAPLDSQDGEEEWNSMLRLLSKYKKEHGHCYIPTNLPGHQRLGHWVHKQRQLYQQQRRRLKAEVGNNVNGDVGSLTEERIQLLEEAGLDLGMDNINYSRKGFHTLWDARVAELVQFKLDHGHFNVEQRNLSYKYHQLEKWVREQRRFYELWKEQGIPSHLNQDRIDQLDSLGFVWGQDEIARN